MDTITLETINSSVNQINSRIDDTNRRLDDLHNRCNETNTTLRLLISENSNSHKHLNRKIDQACRLIAKVEKDMSVCSQKIDDHLEHHIKEDSRASINGVKVTSLIGSFGSALVGALAVLYTIGTV